MKSSVKFGESSVKLGNLPLNDTQRTIMQMIDEDPRMSARQIAEKTDVSVRAIEKNIKELREKGALKRHGAARGGYWEVVK